MTMKDLKRHPSFSSFFGLPTPYLDLNKEPWVTRFDKHLREWAEGPCEHELGGILKDAFLSVDHSTAVRTARRIQGFYEHEYLHSDFFCEYPDDQGMAYFYGSFNEVVFPLATLLPYNSCAQEQLVQLIFELRKVPPMEFKVWGVCYILLCAVPTLVLGLTSFLTSLSGKLPRVDSRP
jgi:hypothetical protein